MLWHLPFPQRTSSPCSPPPPPPLPLPLWSEHTFTCSTVSVFQLLMVAISAHRPSVCLSHCPSVCLCSSPTPPPSLCLHLVSFRVDFFFPYRTNCVLSEKFNEVRAHCNCIAHGCQSCHIYVLSIYTHMHMHAQRHLCCICIR